MRFIAKGAACRITHGDRPISIAHTHTRIQTYQTASTTLISLGSTIAIPLRSSASARANDIFDPYPQKQHHRTRPIEHHSNNPNISALISGWWLGHPSEKYVVNWDDDINPILMGKFQKWQPNHQPEYDPVIFMSFFNSTKRPPDFDRILPMFIP